MDSPPLRSEGMGHPCGREGNRPVKIGKHGRDRSRKRRFFRLFLPLHWVSRAGCARVERAVFPVLYAQLSQLTAVGIMPFASTDSSTARQLYALTEVGTVERNALQNMTPKGRLAQPAAHCSPRVAWRTGVLQATSPLPPTKRDIVRNSVGWPPGLANLGATRPGACALLLPTFLTILPRWRSSYRSGVDLTGGHVRRPSRERHYYHFIEYNPC